MKIFNYLNGIFYVFYGLFGTFMPKGMAELMGWELSILGLHQLRAISLVMATLGVMCLLSTNKTANQKPITLALIFVTLSFLTGRILGLVLDGAGPRQTYHEIGIEALVIAIGTFLYKRG